MIQKAKCNVNLYLSLILTQYKCQAADPPLLVNKPQGAFIEKIEPTSN